MQDLDVNSRWRTLRRKPRKTVPLVSQAQDEAEAERAAEPAGDSAAAGAGAEAAAGGDDHAAGDDARHPEGEDEQEEALLQESPPSGSAPQGLERWRGKVALVTGQQGSIIP